MVGFENEIKNAKFAKIAVVFHLKASVPETHRRFASPRLNSHCRRQNATIPFDKFAKRSAIALCALRLLFANFDEIYLINNSARLRLIAPACKR